MSEIAKEASKGVSLSIFEILIISNYNALYYDD